MGYDSITNFAIATSKDEESIEKYFEDFSLWIEKIIPFYDVDFITI